MKLRLLALFALVLSCDFATLPAESVFRCEADKTCSQTTADGAPYVCGADDFCRPPSTTNTGTEDGGQGDGGTVTDGGACSPLLVCPAASCGQVPDNCGGVLNCPGCGVGTFCGAGNTCQACSAIADLPDDAFADSDCDGFDGQLDGGIFLSPNGSDSAAGTKTQPVRTLATAFARAAVSAHKTIYAATGTYDAGNGVNWDTPVSLYGGYSADFSDRSNLIARPLFVGGSGALMRVSASDGGFIIDHVAFQSANAQLSGQPSLVMTVISKSTPTLRHVSLRAGNGGSGAAGSVGANGVDGIKGANGNNQVSNSSPGANGGVTTGSSCGALGGKGGTGGSYGYTYGSYTQGIGGDGDRGLGNTAALGTGGLRFIGCDFMACPPCAVSGAAGNGAPGGPGTDGSPGSRGDGGSGTGSVSAGTWIADIAAPGTMGVDGVAGNGGGGGGAHLAKTSTTNYCTYSLPGGGGGAGASGGCAGSGGTGGVSGGGSIGLLLVDARLTATDLVIQTGIGGNGGAGGAGGQGGRGADGGAGGLGFPSDPDYGGNGGAGGKSGAGGAGGPGGGGGGGPSVGIFCAGSAEVVHDGGIVFSGGAGGFASDNGRPGISGAAYSCVGFP